MNTPASRTVETRSEAETEALAAAVARALRPGDLVALLGDLGAGKTRFVRGLARGLGVDPDLVHSPTFVLANEYPIPPAVAGRWGGSARGVLIHADAYRLTEDDEHASLALDRLGDGRSIVAIEWPERLADLPDEPALVVILEHEDETTRRITLEGAERLLGA
jgi:tRNA threonylcarbamoyladenosine biosynthesis protein TsaE